MESYNYRGGDDYLARNCAAVTSLYGSKRGESVDGLRVVAILLKREGN